MIVSKRKSSKWRLRINDMTIKQRHEFTYLGKVLIDDGKCESERALN